MIIIYIIILCFNIIFNYENLMDSIYSSVVIWFINIYPSMFIFYNISIYLQYNTFVLKFCSIFKYIIKFDSDKSYLLFFISVFLGNPGINSIISKAYNANEISERDYIFLNKCCLFMNPLFVISFVPLHYYFIYLISIFLYIKLLGIFYKPNCYNTSFIISNGNNYSMKVFYEGINNLINVLLNIACMITFFNILNNTILFFSSHIGIYNNYLLNIFLSFFEVTSGLYFAKEINNIYYIIFLISFQGCCILFQSFYYFNKKNISFVRYILYKLVSSFFISLIFYIITILFHI